MLLLHSLLVSFLIYTSILANSLQQTTPQDSEAPSSVPRHRNLPRSLGAIQLRHELHLLCSKPVYSHRLLCIIPRPLDHAAASCVLDRRLVYKAAHLWELPATAAHALPPQYTHEGSAQSNDSGSCTIYSHNLSHMLRCFVCVFLQTEVDFRASCFCHKRQIEEAYMCSVCLSVFCEPLDRCSTCDTPTRSSYKRNRAAAQLDGASNGNAISSSTS